PGDAVLRLRIAHIPAKRHLPLLAPMRKMNPLIELIPDPKQAIRITHRPEVSGRVGIVAGPQRVGRMLAAGMSHTPDEILLLVQTPGTVDRVKVKQKLGFAANIE